MTSFCSSTSSPCWWCQQNVCWCMLGCLCPKQNFIVWGLTTEKMPLEIIKFSPCSELRWGMKMLLGNDATHPCVEFIVLTKSISMVDDKKKTWNFPFWYFLSIYDFTIVIMAEKWIFYGSRHELSRSIIIQRVDCVSKLPDNFGLRRKTFHENKNFSIIRP